MSSYLFREEALVAKRGEWLGTIRLQAPRLGWVFFSIGLLSVIAILGLLLGGHYTRHEQVAGMLVPSSGLVTIAPGVAGTVTRVQVREGDSVAPGQSLVEISVEEVSASYGGTSAAIATQLHIKHNHLEADLHDQQRLADLRMADIRSRLALLHRRIAQTEQQVKLQRRRADSAMALYSQWAKLGNSGVVSKFQVLQQYDTALQNAATLKELKGQKLELQQQASELQGQLDQLPVTLSVNRNNTRRQLADVAQSLAQNSARRAVLLRAPVAGTITNILIHPGQAVTAHQSLLTVLPSNSQLLAELWVTSRAVGFIHIGETVLMRYQAFPYQKFGQHVGRVSDVSRSAVSATEVSQILGHSILEPRYRVEVTLDSQNVLAYGRSESLRPGMTLDADIQLDRRRLIEWALEPLYGFARGLRTSSTMDGREAR